MTSVPWWMKAGMVGLLVALLAGGAAFYRAQMRQLRAEAEGELSSVAALQVSQLAAWRAERLADAAALAENPLLHDALRRWQAASGGGSAEPLRGCLEAVRQEYGYAEALLVDPHGVPLAAAGTTATALEADDARAVGEALRERRAVFADLHATSPGQPVQLAAVAPVTLGEPGGATLGAVVLVTDASVFLYPLLRSWPLPSRSAESLLVRRDGDSVVFLNDLRHREHTALQLRIPLTRTDVPAVKAVLGAEGVFGGTDYRGVRVVSVLRSVPGSSWHLVAKVDDAEVYAMRRQTAALILIAMLVAAMLLVAAGLVAWQSTRKAFWRLSYQSEASLRAGEARYGITLHGIGDAVIATDSTGSVELMNPVAAELTGWTMAEAQGRPLTEVFQIVNEESRAPVESPVEKVLREGVVVNLANHTLLLGRDGREHPIADSGAPIVDDTGAITGVVLVFRDQTDERAAQAALRREGDNLRAVMAASPVGLMVIDANTEVVAANPASERLFNRCLADLVHHRCGDLLGCTNRHISPDGCGTTAACPACPLLSAIKATLAGAGGVYDREMDGVFEGVGAAAATRRWLRFSVEAALLNGQAHAIAALQDVTERRRSEEALRESERTLNEAQRVARIGSYRYDVTSDRWSSSAALDGIFGIDASYVRDAAGWLALVHPDDREMMAQHLHEHVLRDGQPFDREYRVVGGAERWVHGRGLVTADGPDGRPFMVGTIQDITERRQRVAEHEALQQRLLQSQRLESVGRLAGGVAHDFNNMLGVILGHAELAMAATPEGQEVQDDLRQIRLAAERSTELTRQLLAFARQQTAAPQVLDLNAAIAATLRLLVRLIGEDIAVAWQPGAGLGAVRLDPAQLDQILTNLCVNARDAIDSVGHVAIQTATVSLDVSAAAVLHLPPGDYVSLSVSDDGCGMDDDVAARVFEPFYTTKPLGKGTGLGLATVYGIVQQNHGTIDVISEPGRGSTFTVYLPRVAASSRPVEPAPAAELPLGQGQTILVVEDEPATLQMSRRMLEGLGYRVLVAQGPAEALAVAAAHAEIQLLLTDVVMPQMQGRELSERVAALRPDTRCLFMSGYTADVIATRGVLDDGVQFMGKPFTRAELAAKVHAALQSAGT